MDLGYDAPTAGDGLAGAAPNAMEAMELDGRRGWQFAVQQWGEAAKITPDLGALVRRTTGATFGRRGFLKERGRYTMAVAELGLWRSVARTGDRAARRTTNGAIDMLHETAQAFGVQTIREQVRDFILRNFLFGEDATALDEDASLLETGVVDPTGVLEIALFVEETYGVTVAQDDLTPERFDSVNGIARFVAERLQNS